MAIAAWQKNVARLDALRAAAAVRRADLPSPLQWWEEEQASRIRRAVARGGAAARRPLRALALAAGAFVLGARVVSGPESAVAALDLRRELEQRTMELNARQGELELARLELARMRTILENSARYGIPADLAADIYDIALAEGIDPAVAYRLVRAESGFSGSAVSPKGAVGLTQLLPSTASLLDRDIEHRELFDRETNLRLGFRYLRLLLDRYRGDVRLALLAYNRGPGVVDSLRREGQNPENGFARAVLGRRR